MNFTNRATTLSTTFQELGLRYTDNEPLIQVFYDELSTAYNGSSRYYHSLAHLSFMLKEIKESNLYFQDGDATLFALYYHDMMYEPTRNDNEERSAAIATERLQAMNCPLTLITNCKQLILASKGHEESLNNDVNLFTDIDLAVLGKPWKHYQRYLQAIRKEYAMYSDEAYCKGRQKVLHHFLAMPFIFKTTYFRTLYEVNARENIKQELLYIIS